MMPRSLQWDGWPVSFGPQTGFKGLRTPRTHITAEAAWSTLSVLPTIADLTLDIVGPDRAGRVAAAAASLQPRLRVLKLIFWRRFTMLADQDLVALSMISTQEVLEIGYQSLVDSQTSSVNAEHWRAFVQRLPHLKVLRLPQSLEVP